MVEAPATLAGKDSPTRTTLAVAGVASKFTRGALSRATKGATGIAGTVHLTWNGWTLRKTLSFSAFS